MITIKCWTGDTWVADDYEAARQMIRDAAELYLEDETDEIRWAHGAISTKAVIWSEGEPTGYWWEIQG